MVSMEDAGDPPRLLITLALWIPHEILSHNVHSIENRTRLTISQKEIPKKDRVYKHIQTIEIALDGLNDYTDNPRKKLTGAWGLCR